MVRRLCLGLLLHGGFMGRILIHYQHCSNFRFVHIDHSQKLRRIEDEQNYYCL